MNQVQMSSGNNALAPEVNQVQANHAQVENQRLRKVDAPPQSQVYKYRFFFHGDGMNLAGLIIKNQILTILTGGIYRFWGNVALRKYLSNQTEFNGRSFTFSGTGSELFVGAIKFGALIMFAMLALVFKDMFVAGFAAGAKNPGLTIMVGLLLQIPVSLGFLYSLGYGQFAARRYYLARTQWGGNQFGLQAKNKEFAKLYMINRIKIFFTLGFYSPIAANQEYKLKMNNMFLGTLQFKYLGKDKEVFNLFLKHLGLILLTFGIGYIWYSAELKKYRAQNTWLGSKNNGAVRGRLKLTGMDLFTLYLLNTFCLIVTFGLAAPWIIAHNYSFQLNRFNFIGMIDLNNVEANMAEGDALGDVFASSLYMGFIL